MNDILVTVCCHRKVVFRPPIYYEKKIIKWSVQTTLLSPYDTEFNLDKVIQFLTELYSEENLSMRGLRISSDKHHAAAHSQHEVA